MGEVTVKFNILPALAAALPAQAQALQEQAVSKIADAAKQFAPVASGALRDSIAVDASVPGVMRIVATADYAIWVHYGTRRMPPRPFLLWAVESMQSTYLNDLSGLMEQIARSNGAR